jgi:hypothetical protein
MNKNTADLSKNENSKVRFDLEHRKVVLSASLVSILVVLSVFNQTLFSPAKSTPVRQARGIASMEDSPEVQQLQTQWEYRLAKQMAHFDAESGERDTASIGQMPSPMEQLRFGLLENKYQFNFKEGKVSALHFPENSPDRPKYITEGKTFLLEHQKLFAIDFKNVKQAARKPADDKTTESFSLLDGDLKTIGNATVVTDQYGRLLSVELND